MKKNSGITLEEIERYWGSLEAYNEEQRRTGLSELEALQIKSQNSYMMPNLIENRLSYYPVWKFVSHQAANRHFDRTV